MRTMSKRLKLAAKVIKAVGLKGDVKVYPFDPSFETYANEDFLFIGDDIEATQAVSYTHLRAHET